MKIKLNQEKHRKKQVHEYYKSFKKQKKLFKGIYITKTGDKPNGFDDTEIKNIICLSYKEDIIRWIESCYFEKEIIYYPHIISALKQYIDIIKSELNILEDKEMSEIINYFMDDKNYDNIKLFFQNKKYFDDALVAYIKKIRNELFKEVRNIVIQEANKKNIFNVELIGEKNLLIKKNNFEFLLKIIEEENGYGSSWCVANSNDTGAIQCGLIEKSWQGISFKEINDYIDKDMGSIEIIDSIKNEQKRKEIIIEISVGILNRLELVYPDIEKWLKCKI